MMVRDLMVPLLLPGPKANDVTCVDTLTTSYLSQTTIEAGSAAETACKKKHEQYKKLIISSGFNFKAFSF
jgi:hypothetical protein